MSECVGFKRMSHVVGFGDRSTGRGTFGANLGRAIVTNGYLLSQRRGPFPKLLWAACYYYYSAALLSLEE